MQYAFWVLVVAFQCRLFPEAVIDIPSVVLLF